MPPRRVLRRYRRHDRSQAGNQPAETVSRWPTTTPPGAEIDVGSRLRALREERKLSLRELAEKSGLALNTVSLIENAKTSPSVGTLQQLAIALKVPITAFFETNIPKKSIVYMKADQRPRAAFAHGLLEDLGAGLADRAVEPFLVTLQPSMGSGPNGIVHTGYEFVYCLKGRITYTIADQTYVLEEGDSLLFESRLSHCWRNKDAQPAQAILVLYPSDMHDHPTEQHFIPGESRW